MKQTVQPFLMFQGKVAEEALKFYVSLIPGSEITSVTRYGPGQPGPEGSVSKLLWIEAEQTINHLAMDLLGPDALVGFPSEWLSSYLYSRASSVYGGTAQIQKNLLAERVLMMPRSAK